MRKERERGRGERDSDLDREGGEKGKRQGRRPRESDSGVGSERRK